MNPFYRYITPILALALLSMVLHVGVYHAHDVFGQVQHENVDHTTSDSSRDHNRAQSNPVKANVSHCVAGLVHLTTGEVVHALSKDIVVVEYVYIHQDHYYVDPSRFGLFGRAPPVVMI